MKYHAFISYSHQDRKWGDWLHRALETYRVPRSLVRRSAAAGRRLPERIFPVFRDREELPTATNLGAVIQSALQESRFLIIICSPRAARSQWVNQEIRAFKQLGRADHILALIIDGEPNAADGKAGYVVDDECFPPALRFVNDPAVAAGSARVEPIAADLRPDGDGKRDALLKVIAGLLGVGFDDLKRRDEIRRRMRARVWLGATTGLAMVMAALSALSLWQWREAEEQRADARRSEQRALVSEDRAVQARDEARQTLARSLHQQGVAAWAAGDHQKAVAHLTAALRGDVADPVYGASVGSLLLQPPRFLTPKNPLQLGGRPMRIAAGGGTGELLIATIGGGLWQVDVQSGQVISHKPDTAGGLLNVNASPDGDTRAVATMRGVEVWQTSSFDLAPDREIAVQGAILGPDLVVSGSGRHLLARSSFQTLLFKAEADTMTHLDILTGEAMPLALKSPAVIRHSQAVPGSDDVYFLHEDGLFFAWNPAIGWHQPFAVGVHVEGFTVCSDGSKVALSSVAGVTIVDRRDGQMIATIKQPTWTSNPGGNLVFSPDGNELAVVWDGSGGYWLGLYDADSGAMVSARLFNLEWKPNHLGFDDAGKRILVGGLSGDLLAVEVDGWRPVLRVAHGDDRVFGGFLPGGIAWSYGDDGWLRYWQAGGSSGGGLQIPVGLAIDEIAIREEDGLALLTLEGRRWHQLWSLSRNMPLHPPVFHGGAQINRALLPPTGDGAYLLINNQRLERWDGGGHLQASFPDNWAASPGIMDERGGDIFFHYWKLLGDIAFSPEGFIVLPEAKFDLDRAQRVMGPIAGWTPDSAWDELRRSDAFRGRLIFLEAETLLEVDATELSFPPMWPNFSGDGSTLVIEHSGGRPGVRWYRRDEAGNWVLTNDPWTGDGSDPGEPVETFVGRGLSRDGSVLYRRYPGRSLEILYRDPDGVRDESLTIFAERTVVDTAFSPSGAWLAVALDSGSDRHLVQVYDTRSGDRAGPTLEHQGSIISMQFTEEEDYLFTAARDNTIRRWHFPTGRLAAVPLRHPARLNGFVWVESWRELITYSDDGNLTSRPFPLGDDFSPPLIDAAEALWEIRMDESLREEPLSPMLKWDLQGSKNWYGDGDSWWLAAFYAALANQPAPRLWQGADLAVGGFADRAPVVAKGNVSFGGSDWAISGNGKVVITIHPEHIDVVLYDFSVWSSGRSPFELHRVVASLIEYNDSGRYNFVDGSAAEWVLDTPRVIDQRYDPGALLLRLPVGADALKGREIRMFFHSADGFVPARLSVRIATE